MENKIDLTVLIPAYNASNCISDLVNTIVEVLNIQKISYEILIIDDNSSDQTWEKIRELKSKNSFIRAFSLLKNYGQHKATLCGMINSRGRVVITIDDDFENNPSDIIKLYHSIFSSNADVVYAEPNNRKKSIFRRMVTKLYKTISKIENPLAGRGSSFRALKKEIVEKIIQHNHHLFFIDELVLWYTNRIEFIDISFSNSKKTRSGYNFFKLFSLSSDVFMISTTMPLKIVKMLGLSTSLISILIGFFYLIKKFLLKTPAGYTSIIVSILFSSGLILLCMGVIGEYLANVLMMQTNKPAFQIKEEL
jgi:undecaprenyl-phosphate 4-deoxy-4-formamido-L-arabinose transferase